MYKHNLYEKIGDKEINFLNIKLFQKPLKLLLLGIVSHYCI